MRGTFDVIVVGTGSMGSSACYHLARRGLSVLGLDRLEVPNRRGSHHGRSRMIRLAYFEHPDYIALLRRAYENWETLQREYGAQLLHITGGLYLGPPDSELVAGSLEAAERHELPHEVIEPHTIRDRFPEFRLPEEMVGFYEPQAGFLVPEKVVAAQAELAVRHGAQLHERERVTDWGADGSGVVVRTDAGEYHAGKLVFAAGAWSIGLLDEVGVDLTVTRQTMAWFSPAHPEQFAVGTFPCWAIDPVPRGQHRGLLYGFPVTADRPGFKIAHHWPAEPCDPDRVDRDPRPDDEEPLREALGRYVPSACGPLLSLCICLYTNTSDGHFVIDLHPNHERVVVAAGFSGHGFKFVSVVGEVLADLAAEGRTDLPVEFLGLSRFGPRSEPRDQTNSTPPTEERT